MSILVNFYSASHPKAATGQDLDILGGQTQPGTVVDDGENSVELDHDALVLIQAITSSWVALGVADAATINQSEKIEAGDYRIRFLTAGSVISCEAATSSQADLVLLQSLDDKLQSIDDHLQSIDDNLATPATDLPAFVRKATLDLSVKKISCAQNTDYQLVAAVAGQSVKLYRLRGSIKGADCTVQLWDGPSASGTLIEEWDFPATGGYINLNDLIWPLFQATTAGNGLFLKISSASAVFKGAAHFLQG